MNLAKSLEVFNPEEHVDRIHVIGCGSVGSCVVELLARFGLTKFTLYDFDTVESKNLSNQMFFAEDVGHPKVEALANLVCRINHDAKNDIKVDATGWHGQRLSGIVILAPDSIEVRQQVVDTNRYNKFVKAMFDVRTGLWDAQLYAADWSKPDMVENLRNTMAFTHEEAKAETPMSACGVILGVAPTVRAAATFTVTNIINYMKDSSKIKKMIVVQPFEMSAPDSAVLSL